MTAHMQRVRLFTTTSSLVTANGDTNQHSSAVNLRFSIDSMNRNPNGDREWIPMELNQTRIDNKRGTIQIYQVDFTHENCGSRCDGSPVPPGIKFQDLDHARTGNFWLRLFADEQWEIDQYVLMGYFHEMLRISARIDSFQTIDHGWLEMARSNEEIKLGPEPYHGKLWHPLELNGTF